MRYLGSILSAVALAVLLLSGCTTKRDPAGPSLSDIGGVPAKDAVKTFPTPIENLDNAKSYFTSRDYTRAIEAFQKVLVTNPSQEELAIAYAGIGWSRVKSSGAIRDGKDDFRNAYNARSTVADGKVGLAAALALGGTSEIREAITILESFGRENTGGVTLFDPSFTYRSELGTGISSGRVHALLATLYYENNQDAQAKRQVDVAKLQDPDSDRVRSVDTAIVTLGY